MKTAEEIIWQKSLGDNVYSQGLQTLESQHREVRHYEGEEG